MPTKYLNTCSISNYSEVLTSKMESNEISKNILKSGTSIVGIVCKDGVIMGADRRATAGGQMVVSKNSKKVVKVNDYITVSGAGVAADIDFYQKIFAAELRLKELKTKIRPSIEEAANFLGMLVYRNIRTPSMIPPIVGLLVAGVDEDGTTELYSIEPERGI